MSLSLKEALERRLCETMPADFTNISLSEMHTIKGKFIDESIDTLQYFNYNNQTKMLFLHCTLLYLYRASLSDELTYTCLQYCFVVIYTKQKITLTSKEKELPFFQSRVIGLRGFGCMSSEYCWKPLICKAMQPVCQFLFIYLCLLNILLAGIHKASL